MSNLLCCSTKVVVGLAGGVHRWGAVVDVEH